MWTQDYCLSLWFCLTICSVLTLYTVSGSWIHFISSFWLVKWSIWWSAVRYRKLEPWPDPVKTLLMFLCKMGSFLEYLCLLVFPRILFYASSISLQIHFWSSHFFATKRAFSGFPTVNPAAWEMVVLSSSLLIMWRCGEKQNGGWVWMVILPKILLLLGGICNSST